MQMFQNAIKEATKQPDDWIGLDEAMTLLMVKSKTTMQRLRDNDEIKFTKPSPRIILYSKQSLLAYLKRNIPKY
ncbi:UNVERIFIED_CONTAM: helix-turn-helix domain-containing protein [Salmonella enterica subsp. enterica serovar Weltevreden]